MKKEFDIKYKPQIESGEYTLKTKNGEDVRVILWPKPESNTNHIVTKVNDDHMEWFDVNGHNVKLDGNDLILVIPGPKPTEFEIGMMDYVRLIAESTDSQDFEDITREYAKHLISIAKKMIVKHIPSWHTSQMNINRDSIDFIVKLRDVNGRTRVVATNRLGIGEEFIEINDLTNFPKNDEE